MAKAPDFVRIERSYEWPFKSHDNPILDLREGGTVELAFGKERKHLITYKIVHLGEYHADLEREKSPTRS